MGSEHFMEEQATQSNSGKEMWHRGFMVNFEQQDHSTLWSHFLYLLEHPFKEFYKMFRKTEGWTVTSVNPRHQHSKHVSFGCKIPGTPFEPSVFHKNLLTKFYFPNKKFCFIFTNFELSKKIVQSADKYR